MKETPENRRNRKKTVLMFFFSFFGKISRFLRNIPFQNAIFLLLMLAFLLRVGGSLYWQQRIDRQNQSSSVSIDDPNLSKDLNLSDKQNSNELLFHQNLVNGQNLSNDLNSADNLSSTKSSKLDDSLSLAESSSSSEYSNLTEHSSSPNLNRTDNLKSVDTDQALFFFGDSDSYWKLARTIVQQKPYQFDEIRHWTIFRMPGYPLILVPLFLIFGENPPILAARIYMSLWGTGTVFAVILLSLIFFKKHPQKNVIALLAGFFAAVDPTLVVQSVLILSEEPFCFFMLFQLLFLVLFWRNLRDLRFQKTPSKSNRSVFWKTCLPAGTKTLWTNALILGLISAITVYIRPGWLYFLLFAFLTVFFIEIVLFFVRRKKRSVLLYSAGTKQELSEILSRKPAEELPKKLPENLSKEQSKELSEELPKELSENLPKKQLKEICFQEYFSKISAAGLAFVLVFLAFGIPLVPWMQRNFRLNGTRTATTLQMGASLYDAWNPIADGSSNMEFVDRFRKIVADEMSTEGIYPKNKTDAVYFAQLEFRLDKRLKSEAIRWAKEHPEQAMKLSAIKFLRLWSPIPNEASLSSPLIASVVLCSYLPILILGLAGGFLTFKDGAEYWLLGVPILYLSALHLIFVSSLRYRTPAMFGLMILAAWMFVYLGNQQKNTEIAEKPMDSCSKYPQKKF